MHKTHCYVADFGTTSAQRLNHSRASAMLHSNLIASKFGTAEARRLNWAWEGGPASRLLRPSRFFYGWHLNNRHTCLCKLTEAELKVIPGPP